MRPITDVREISSIGYGFMASKALFTALDLDIFTRLSGQPQNLDYLAREAGVRPNQLLTLMTALVCLGLVAKEGALYANAPASEAYLARHSPKYYGDYLRLQIDKQVYPSLLELTASFRGERKGFYETFLADPEQADLFSRAQHVGSLGPARVLARQIPLDGRGTLLDVGGGSGAFSITLCQRNPKLTSTILDFPSVGETARRYVEEAGLASRIAFLPGDALDTEWPGDRDAILMSYVLSAVGERDVTTLIERAYGALRPDGLLVVHDFMVDDDRTGPLSAALWFLPMALRGDAISLTPGDLSEAIRAAGFEGVAVQDLIPTITKALTARRP